VAGRWPSGGLSTKCRRLIRVRRRNAAAATLSLMTSFVIGDNRPWATARRAARREAHAPLKGPGRLFGRGL